MGCLYCGTNWNAKEEYIIDYEDISLFCSKICEEAYKQLIENSK